jgi:hypothetical protein
MDPRLSKCSGSRQLLTILSAEAVPHKIEDFKNYYMKTVSSALRPRPSGFGHRLGWKKSCRFYKSKIPILAGVFDGRLGFRQLAILKSTDQFHSPRLRKK